MRILFWVTKYQRIILPLCLALGFQLFVPVSGQQAVAGSNPLATPAAVTTAAIQPGSLRPVMVLLGSGYQDSASFGQVMSAIEAAHGQIVHIFPNIALIARVDAAGEGLVRAMPPVAAVLTGPVDEAALERSGPAAHRYGEMWHNLVTPADQQPLLAGADEKLPDAFTAPESSPAGSIKLASAGSITPDERQTSEFMVGRVAVGLVLVESNGAIDASTENWTDAEKQLVFNKVVSALNWWAQREPRARLSFVYDDHFSNPLPTGVEPIARPNWDQGDWIADAMFGLGFTGSDYFAQVRNYDNWLRTTYQTDWAFTIFVVDSSSDSDNRFSNGYFAYAYLGGPFIVMTYGNDGYGPEYMDAVAAHEIGHIFRALDQYAGAYQGCTIASGYLNIENQNSQYGSCLSNVNSIMRGQIYPFIVKAIDPYAAAQLGWRDSDGDNILDPLDTGLSLQVEEFAQTGNQVHARGEVNLSPFPAPRGKSITINHISQIQYRLDGGGWDTIQPADGLFDSVTEDFELTLTGLPVGLRMFELAALDSAGNVSASYTKTIAVLDPVDGGLNTDLAIPTSPLSAAELPAIEGVAYHMQGKVISKVECRLNGGPWQLAQASDGSFDSPSERFTFALGSAGLTPGRYLVEARASDAGGKTEINFASKILELRAAPKIFLPLVIR